MLYVNQKIQNLIDKIDYKQLYVVADFDRTITKGKSKTSWAILADSKLLPDDYINDRHKLYNYYRPIEIDEFENEIIKQQAMKDWYHKHIELFIKYQLKEELIEKASNDFRIMEFRKGAKEFSQFLYENHIPLIIISAGIGNFIKAFLEQNNCNYDNIYISSNMIVFKDGIAVGVGNNIIHSLNKNEVSLPGPIKRKISNRSQILLLGDQISDIKMVNASKRENTIRIGFLTEETKHNTTHFCKSFDIICDDDSTYYDIIHEIFKI